MKKKKLNLFLLIYTIIGIVLILFLAYRVYDDFFKKEQSVEEEKYIEIKPYGYTLRDNDTAIYKTYFNELKEELSKEDTDYKTYAELLSKLFIIDLYTLKNKIASTDIGALEFIHPNQIDNFKINAGDTLYKYVENNFDGKRMQILPEIKEVTLNSVEESTYEINDVKYDSYKINASFEYVEDLGYETEKGLVIVKIDDKLYVVEGLSE
jgi:hypothetical protein